MKRIIISIICVFMLQSGLSVASGAFRATERVGIAYDNVLEKGWSCLYPWFKGKGIYAHVKNYRRRIIDIKFTRKGLFLFFANGSKRDIYRIAIINNMTTENGGTKYWKIARKHKRKDTLVLKSGEVIHCLIRGYEKDFYIFNDIKPIHRDYIRLIYPNPSVPLRARK